MASKIIYITEDELKKMAEDFATKLLNENRDAGINLRNIIVEAYCIGFKASTVSSGEIEVPGF